MTTGSAVSQLFFSNRRYCLLWDFIAGYLITSFLIRLVFFFWQYQDVSWGILSVVRTIITGAFYDFGTALFISLPGVLYLTFLPNRFVGSLLDRLLVYFFYSLTIFVLVFTFFAEITFWEEFRARFNFIAVDYLIYTYEVISNINESYPLPLLLSGVVIVTAAIVFVLQRKKIFQDTFLHKPQIGQRLSILLPVASLLLLFTSLVTNEDAEWSNNRYNNEISKSGIYSFFAAMRTNRIEYDRFYTTVDNNEAFKIVRSELTEDNIKFVAAKDLSIARNVSYTDVPVQPNVVFILMESMSASFMKEFGNQANITPYLDTIASHGVFFKNLYATGTRTVRGMEAVTLCIPPTPGQSIVKRPDNHNLYTVASVFHEKGYESSFFYGGDGYFDNMNSYFGGNGFTIYDRGRGSILSDDIKTTRHDIDDSEVTFENAWGICDEDIYNKMLKVADNHYEQGKPFFNFVMTTSNHKPYTYPGGKIDIPSGTGREGAVKYADYALGIMLQDARKRPWFKNTVFVIVADHCASSAGKDEIDVANYHIPAIFYNLNNEKMEVNKQCSQIDLFPTLFSRLHWDYRSNFFGEDILDRKFKERALIATYIKLGLLHNNEVIVLSDQKRQSLYYWNKTDNSLTPKKMKMPFLSEAIAWYQAADYLYTNKLLKE